MGRAVKDMLAADEVTPSGNTSIRNYTSPGGSTAEELLRRLHEIRERGRAAPARPAVIERERSLPIHPAAVLVGLAAGWQSAGLAGIVASIIDPVPRTLTAFAAVSLLTAAVGPWLPERVVLGLVGAAERLRRRPGRRPDERADSSWVLRAVQERDPAVVWLSLAVLCSLAGITALATLLAAGAAGRAYRGILDGFFWVEVSLTAFQWGLMAAYTAPLWIVNGLSAVTLWPVVSSRHHPRRSPAGVAAGVIGGVGIAWITAEVLADRGAASGQIFMAGVVPMFVLAAVAAWISQRCDRRPVENGERAWDPPEETGHAERLIWVSLVVWATASALIAAGWLACRTSPGASWTTGMGWGRFFVFVAGGLALGTFIAGRRTQSASGCGMALWAAGLGTGIGATVLSYPAGPWASAIAEAACVAVPVGFALYYAERGWLARAGSGTLGFAQLASGLMAGLAVGLIASFWMTIPILGPMGTVTIGALLLLAFGGLVQIYERERPPRTRRFRLALVFASMIGAIAVFPSDARRWTARAQRESVRPAPAVPPVPEELGTARRACVIGVDAQTAAAWSLRAAGIDRLALGEAKPLTGGQRGPSSADAMRAIPLEREGYDFIYQYGCGSEPVGRFAPYTLEWLTLLAEHTSPAGRLVLDVPLAPLPRREAVLVIAATFERAVGSPAWYASIDAEGGHLLRLAGRPGGPPGAPGGAGLRWAKVASLMRDAPVLRPHSVRRDGITPVLRGGSP